MRHRKHLAADEGQDTKGERGNGTVQAVALVPLTLLLIFAIVQFANAWYAETALTAAAEDGLRHTQTNINQAPVGSCGPPSPCKVSPGKPNRLPSPSNR